MKTHAIFSLLFVLLFTLACGADDSTTADDSKEAATSTSTATADDRKVAAKSSSEASSSTSVIAGVSACDLLSPQTLAKVFEPNSGFTRDEKNDETGKRVSCKVGVTNGTAQIMWAINRREGGWASNVDRFEAVNAFSPVEVEGADGAYYHGIQKKLEAWKGDYNLTLQAPIDYANPAPDDEIRNAGIMVAEEILRKL